MNEEPTLETLNKKLDLILAVLQEIKIQTQPVTYDPAASGNAKELRGGG